MIDEQPGLQRLSLFNGVFYVHQNPEAEPELEPEAVLASEAEPEAAVEPEPQPEPEPEPEPVRPIWPAWPARTAPPRGYAYEFGTGRLVRVYL